MQEAPQLLLHLEWWRAVLPFRPFARVLTRGARATAGPRWEANSPTLSPADTGDGGRVDRKTLDGARPVDTAARAGTAGHWLRTGAGGRRPPETHEGSWPVVMSGMVTVMRPEFV
jgi:hypothetical protein